MTKTADFILSAIEGGDLEMDPELVDENSATLVIKVGKTLIGRAEFTRDNPVKVTRDGNEITVASGTPRGPQFSIPCDGPDDAEMIYEVFAGAAKGYGEFNWTE